MPAKRRALRLAVVTETYPPEVNGVAMTVSRLVQGLRDRQAHVPPAGANMLFPEWPAGHHEKLEAAGAAYYRFPAPEGRERARLVASWSTTEADVDRFLNAF